jgi:hypothetical protein
MSTWLPWAIKAPAPQDKAGYPNDPGRKLSEILYIVMHSAEGWESYLKQGHRPGADASWTFSNCQNGNFYQHFPLEALTYTSGGYTQNRDGLACENEGVTGQPLNEAQIANGRRLRADVEKLCPNLRPPVFGQGWREHSELTNGATSCPSGRIQPLYDSYKEDDMTLNLDQESTIKTTAAQVLETLHAVFGGTSPARTVKEEESIMGRLRRIEEQLDSQPAVALGKLDYEALVAALGGQEAVLAGLARAIIKVAGED